MRLIAVKGVRLEEAAKRMYISRATATRHSKNILKKLGAHTTPHAVYLWLCAKAREQSGQRGRRR